MLRKIIIVLTESISSSVHSSIKALNEYFIPHRLFKKIDTAGDKKLHFHEFQEAIKVTGVRVDVSIQRQIFDEMDRDGSGSVSYDEFLIALRVSLASTGTTIYLFFSLMVHPG